MATRGETKRWVRTTGCAVLGAGLALVAVGCKNGQTGQQAPIVDGSAVDPAGNNLADVGNVAPGSMQAPTGSYSGSSYAGSGSGRVTYPQTRVEGQVYQAPSTQNESQTYADQYSNGQYPQQPQYNTYNYNYPTTDAEDEQAYSDLLDPNTPVAQQAPPPLPEYEQPPAPGPDYLWTPGYWDYANTGYYYVPGNWVSSPFIGALWTPGWWGFYGGGYHWHRGYWGSHVGFYGGVNYGFGFIGIGYQGGYWNGPHFYYNQYCNHVQPGIVNNYVYNRRTTVINNTYINNTRVSYFGGPGGLNRPASPAEFAAQHEVHMQPLPGQVYNRQQAMGNRNQFFADNHGRPNMMFASNPVAQHNVAVPQQLQHLNPNPQAFQQRIQQQRQIEQANQQRQQQAQQFHGNEQQQRQQAEQQRQQQAQQFHANEQQQRQQAEQQRQQQAQQFHANEQQQREQAANQRQQQEQQHQQQMQAQRQQQNAAREQQQQTRQQQDAQRQQQMQAQRQQQNAAREQQQNTAREQQQQARQQQDAQRQQQMQAQREQQNAARQQQRQQQDAQRQQQQMQRQQEARPQAAPRPQPAPHVEAPHAAAPAPHADGGHPR